MERILTSSQMRECDNFTINKLCVPEETLIERAGQAVAGEIKKRFLGGQVLVCVGKGNNGKDGRIVAEILSKIHGFSVVVLNVTNGIFRLFDRPFNIIVDCIFGTGLHDEVQGKYKTAIDRINESGAYVISCDIPSGINSDTGLVMGCAVKANLTVAIQEYKLGHFLADGIDYCGEVVLKDIGISVWDDDFIKRFNDEDVKKLFIERGRNVHKGMLGKTCIVGGSRRFTGSVILSSSALVAFKMGVGYSHLSVPESLFNGYIGIVPECTLSSLKDNEDGIILCEDEINELLEYDSIAVGMGMGISKGVYDTICYLLKHYKNRLIIDADGINCLAKYGANVLENKKCQVVLTPHIGEFKRLANVEGDDLKANQIQYVKDFAFKHKCIVVLKNAVSVISDGEDVYINTTGCQGMAKAGSGDVLSGIMAGLCADKNNDLMDSCCGACYLFGKIGERVQDQQNQFNMTATDIIKAIPEVVNSILL